MSRGVMTAVLVLVLLGATAAAFAVTENLKLESPTISRTKVTKVFSPVCECDTSRASIAFRLRRADRLTVTVVDAQGRTVRELERGKRVPAGPQLFVWDGRDDDGARVPDGVYRVRVRLARSDRRFEFPNTITLDTRPPRVRLLNLLPRTITPNGDGRRDSVRARYRLDERAHVILYVDGRKAAGPTRFASTDGSLYWGGTVAGHALPRGRYRITLVARDLAGNVSNATPPEAVALVRPRR